jgi:hypothetical protein
MLYEKVTLCTVTTIRNSQAYIHCVDNMRISLSVRTCGTYTNTLGFKILNTFITSFGQYQCITTIITRSSCCHTRYVTGTFRVKISARWPIIVMVFMVLYSPDHSLLYPSINTLIIVFSFDSTWVQKFKVSIINNVIINKLIIIK